MHSNPEARAVPGKPTNHRTVNVYVDGYNFYVPFSSRPPDEYQVAWCDFWRLGKYLVDSLSRERPHEFGGSRLGVVKYFTATIPADLPKDAGGIQRKHDWLDAVHWQSKGRVEITHGTFRTRHHRFYIERTELDELVRSGIPIAWDLLDDRPRFRPQMTIREEKQTDVMLACSLVTDAALGRLGAPPKPIVQKPPEHLTNVRSTPAPCHAAILISADIDFLPAAELAAGLFACPVAIAFAFPHVGYELEELESKRLKTLSTMTISDQELRSCMLPAEVSVGDRTVTLHHFLKTHFDRVKKIGA